MSKNSLIIMTLFLSLLYFVGCSSSNDNPTLPDENLDFISEQSSSENTTHELLGIWTVELNLSQMDANILQERELSAHWNLTSLLPSPTIVVNAYDPISEIVDVDITINNPFGIDGYDVRLIIFTDTVGHKLMNADDWTGLFDISGGLPINPFKEYHFTGSPNRMFPKNTSLTENLRIVLPGGNPNVTFAIDGSFPGNCEEPYEITGFTQDTLYDFAGASTSIGVTVHDWQDNTNSVELYCPQITGGPQVIFSNTSGDLWGAILDNDAPAAAGDYQGFIIAKSSDSGVLALYDEVNITVTAFSSILTIYVDDDNTSGPWDGTIEHPYQYVQDGVDAASNGYTVWIKPGIYNEDPGGDTSSGEAEVTITGIENLTLFGEGMPRIVLHNYYSTGRAAVHAYDSPGLVVDGIEFTPGHAYQSSVWLENCDDSTIQNCTVTPYPASGFLEFFRGEWCDNVVVENNNLDGFRSVSTFSNMFVLNSSNNSRISLNTCRNLTHGGYNMYQTGMTYVGSYNSSFVEISKNIFGEYHRTAPSENYVQLYGIYIYNGTNCVVRNNLIYDLSFYNNETSASIANNLAIHGWNAGKLEVYNNTIDGFGPGNAGVGETSGICLKNSPSSTVYNNIVANISANISADCFGVNSDLACSVDYSDVWNLTGGTTTRFGGLAVDGTGTIETDPMFTDPLNDVYTLLPGSPCEGTGLSGDDMGCYGGADPLP